MRTTTVGEPRGVFCGMGVCFDCLVVVDDKPNTRACMTWVKEGMNIQTQDGLKASN
jgi:aerobic-type carbon monoxide dehydrogenase small subunit (CoxS/CutS family)